MHALKDNNISYSTGVVLVLMAGVFWSSMGVGIRSIEVANVWQILFYRSIALTCFLFIVISYRSKFKPIRTIRKSGLAGIIGGISLVLAFSGGIYGIQMTTVANAMFLFSSAPFMAAVLGWVLLREPVRHSTWIAMVVALVGVIIMVIHGISAGRLEGNIAALISAFGFSVFTIALRWGKLEEMLPAVLLAGIFACIVSASFCYVQDYGLDIPVNDILIALAMGVFQVGLGLAIYTIGSKVVPAVELTLLSMTEVVLGPLWVWLLLGETASFYTLLGGIILMLAIIGNAISGLKRKPVPII
ncbi:MAG: DMT family transporter [Sedimenticola sp.]